MTRGRGILLIAVLALLLWLLLRGGGGSGAPPTLPEPSAGADNRDLTPDLPAALPGGEPVQPAAEEEEEEVPASVRAARRLAVAGRVYHQDGVTPLAGIGLWLLQGAVVEIGESGPDGSFRFEGFCAGQVRIYVKTDEWQYGDGRSTHVRAGDLGVKVVLRARGMLEMEVTDAVTGKPVRSHLRVIVVGRNGEEFTRFTAAGGLSPRLARMRFSGDRPLRLRVTADGYRPSPVHEVAHRTDDPLQTLTVKMWPDPDSLARLSLVLRTADGRIPEAVRVTRHPQRGLVGKSHKALDGIVELELGPGEYDLEIGVKQTGGSSWVPVRFRVRLGFGERVTKEITFAAGGYLRIRGPGDRPPNSVRLDRHGLETVRGGQTLLEDGRKWLRVGPLAVGQWRIQSPEPIDVEIRAGEVTDVVLRPAKADEKGD